MSREVCEVFQVCFKGESSLGKVWVKCVSSGCQVCQVCQVGQVCDKYVKCMSMACQVLSSVTSVCRV